MSKKPLTEIRTVYPFMTFWHLANRLIKNGEKAPHPPDEYLLGLLCLAFCIEGYLNQYIKMRFEDKWEDLERKTSKEKLVLLCKISKYKPNFGIRPFQTFQEIFNFRNTLVHPKTEIRVKRSEQIFTEAEFALPLTDWEKLLNYQRADQFLIDSEKIIRTVHAKAKFTDDPFKIPPWESSIYQYDSQNP